MRTDRKRGGRQTKRRGTGYRETEKKEREKEEINIVCRMSREKGEDGRKPPGKK
jgi:hypothetical protein